MNFDIDILIAGGGLNGLSMALAARQGGFSVMLADPQPAAMRADLGFDGRSYALAISSQRILEALGVWKSLDAVQPILGIKVTDGRAGEGASPLMLAFDHAEIEEGPMGFMVEDRHLRPALLRAAEAAGIDQVEAGIEGFEVDGSGVTARLSDGTSRRARLLIGCDGKSSRVASLSGVRRTGWGYGQTALVCAVSHAKPHGGVAHQFFMPPGPLAILPLTGNRSSIVWSEQTEHATEIQAKDDEGYLDVLRPRFGSFLGDIALSGARFTYPLGLSLADRFVARRVALVGDAAHVVHPIAGQGLNAGLKDVAALAEVMVDARRRGEDIASPQVLDRYAEWRRFDVAVLAAATDAFNRLFSNDNPVLRAVRDIGLGVANALPGLRRGLIREAAGLTGDLPRLMRGRPL